MSSVLVDRFVFLVKLMIHNQINSTYMPEGHYFGSLTVRSVTVWLRIHDIAGWVTPALSVFVQPDPLHDIILLKSFAYRPDDPTHMRAQELAISALIIDTFEGLDAA